MLIYSLLLAEVQEPRPALPSPKGTVVGKSHHCLDLSGGRSIRHVLQQRGHLSHQAPCARVLGQEDLE